MQIVELLFLLLFIMLLTIVYFLKTKLRTSFRIIAYYTPSNFFRKYLFALGGVKIGKNSKINIFVKIMRNVEIGSNSNISSFSLLGPNTVIGASVFIGRNSYIVNSQIGNNARVNAGCLILGTELNKIRIGSNCAIGYYSVLDGSGGLEIGSNVHLASPSIGIWTHSSVDNCLDGEAIGTSLYDQKKVLASVKIGSNTWLGGNSTVMPGVQIGRRTLVMPNSVVNRNLEDSKMYGGVPVQEIEYKRYVSWR